MKYWIVIAVLVVSGCVESAPEANAVSESHGKHGHAMASESSLELPRQIPAHPRLLVTADDFHRAETSTDPLIVQWRHDVLEDARKYLTQPVVAYSKPKGIEVARDLQQRVTHLAVAYRFTHEQRYLDRARAELLAASKFPNWDEPSFLATAEMTTGVALGYDWLYDSIPENERATIREAILAKGLHAGTMGYRHKDFWVEAHHNWNLVCNGGMIVGALAVIDESPSPAQTIVEQANASLKNGLSCFAPDGGWEEGPTYWNYATRYLCFALTSERNVYGSRSPLDASPGLSRTGDFRMDVLGPTGRNFNFGDSTEGSGDSSQMYALARIFHRPVYSAFESRQSHTDPTVLDLLWYQPSGKTDLDDMPKDALFRGIGLATFRSAWLDPNATFVGFKGGSNKAHHGHLDLGTFVLDALGQRWAVDLGSDDYGLPGYFDTQRPTYYRCSTPGHNTLTFEDRNQDSDGLAPMIAFQSTRDHAHAVIDLTKAYAPAIPSHHIMRGIALLNRRDVLVQDEIDLLHAERVTWAMHTAAKITLQGRTAILEQGGQTLTARILYPADVEFQTAPAAAPPPQAQQPDITKLVIRFRVTEPTYIAVLFTPGTAEPQIPKLTAVSDWPDDAGLVEAPHGRRTYVEPKTLEPYPQPPPRRR